MREVRIGLVGTGMMGRTHADAYLRVAEVRRGGLAARGGDSGRAGDGGDDGGGGGLAGSTVGRAVAVAGEDGGAVGRVVAVAGDDGDGTAKLAAQLGAEVRPLSAILDDPEVDAVDICLPTFLHADAATRAMRAGKHVLCEKPLARSAPEAERMVRAARAAGVKLGVAHVLRWSPDYLRARSLVRAGELGAVRLVRAVRAGPFPSHGRGGWYADASKSGGCILDLAIHDFDFARWLLGPVREVYCLAPAWARDEAVRYAHATLSMESGAIVSVEASWAEPEGTPFDAKTLLFGDRGCLEWSDRAGIALRVGTASAVVEDVPILLDGYAREVAAFVDWVANGVPFEAPGPEGVEAVRICDAAARSLRAGEPVEVGR